MTTASRGLVQLRRPPGSGAEPRKALFLDDSLVYKRDRFYNLAGPRLLAAAMDWGVATPDSTTLRTHDLTDEEVLGRIERFGPDVIGLSAYVWNVERFLRLAAQARQRGVESQIVMGGPSTSSVVEGVYGSAHGVDLIVCGEGEEVFAQILRGDEPSSLPGVYWAEGGRWRTVSPLRVIEHLDRLPSPYSSERDLVIDDQVNPALLEFSRGCPYRCAYCSWPSNNSRQIRSFGAHRMREEVAWAVRRGVTQAWVVDAAVNYVEEIHEQILDAFEAEDPRKQIGVFCFVKYEFVKQHQIERMARVMNVRDLHMPFESTNQVALKAGRRPFNAERFDRALDIIKNHGILPSVEILLGLPGDTPEGFARSLNFALEREVNVNVFNVVAYPGSELYTRRQEYGLELADGAMPFVISSPTFTRDEMNAARATVRNISANLSASGARNTLRMEAAEAAHDEPDGPQHAARSLGGL